MNLTENVNAAISAAFDAGRHDEVFELAELMRDLSSSAEELASAQTDYDRHLAQLDSLLKALDPSTEPAPDANNEDGTFGTLDLGLGAMRSLLRNEGFPVPIGFGSKRRCTEMIEALNRGELDITAISGKYAPLDWPEPEPVQDAPESTQEAPAPDGKPEPSDAAESDAGTRCPGCDTLVEDCSCVPY